MAHVRQQIRNAVTAAVTGLTTTGTKVFQSRKYPLQAAELPGLLVYTMGEESRVTSALGGAGFGRLLERTVIVRVMGVAKQTANLDTTLDTIAEEVETAIGNDPTLGGTAKSATLINTELMLQTINDEEISDQPIGVVAMDWSVFYMTRENTPGIGA